MPPSASLEPEAAAGTHPWINPSGLVALCPEADFDAPHGRERLGSGARRAA